MSDVARQAGVSRTTVSFVLNKRHRDVGISDETKRRVLDAARQMGYRRNAIARAMVTGRSHVLAFLVNAPESEVTGRVLAGALEAAEDAGYFIKVIRAEAHPGQDYIAQCAELRLAGVLTIYLGGSELGRLQTEMARAGIPVAVLDSSFPQPRGIRVISDDVQGCRLALTHLAALGHRKIAYISGHCSSGASAHREAAFRVALAETDLVLPPGCLAHGGWDIALTTEATRRLFENSRPAERPTAVLCADDKMALIASRTLRKLHLRVPEDVSVVGFADLNMAQYGDPPLTTVAQPFMDMGRTAVRRLLAASEKPEPGGETVENPMKEEVLLPTHLVIRELTAAASSA